MGFSVIPGQRFLIKDAQVIMLTHYQAPLPGPKDRGEGTVWRYLFKSPEGKAVYSGKWLGLELGQMVDLRATCKRFEYFKGVELCRISRPTLLEKIC